ncbi:MarR family winged helix-turn-helix transcriptional regulator [Nocardioides sp. URHA0020]|uniref:MarR family winged helix-turn-helix transcriptional regulator n=1 Tax=Nocardioides sp. URHA0020 TaxID=1380392 RepID=UPI000490A1EB|nr:MarR family transcriptional regulator [Nocardioides sp. URHA0020]
MTPADGEVPAPGPATEYAERFVQTPSLQALRAVIEAGSKVRRVVARRAGLGESELAALQHLILGARGPGEVARLLEVSTAASTGIVDRLVAHGHVERRPHPEDRRRTDVHVTDSGREEVLGLLLPMFVELARLDAEFDEDERAVVARYLTRTLQAFDVVVDQEGLVAQPPPSLA